MPEVPSDREVPASGAQSDPQLARVLRAKALVEMKRLSRATKALLQGDLASMTESTITALRALHPKATDPVPALPEEAPRIQVDTEVLVSLVRKRVANGSSPSYSGWTGELLLALLDDLDCLHGLAQIVEDQLNGSLDDMTRDFILGSCLIAGAKPTGGVRPIAMGEPIYKLAGQYALYLVRQELPPLVEPIQLSLSPGGSERAAHVLQAAIETGGHDSIVVKTDFRNAFNTIKRSSLLGEMFKAPSLSRIWRFVHWAYKAPSSLLLVDQGAVVGELPSSEGVRQGDVLGASLFALAVQPLLEVRQEPSNREGIGHLRRLRVGRTAKGCPGGL